MVYAAQPTEGSAGKPAEPGEASTGAAQFCPSCERKRIIIATSTITIIITTTIIIIIINIIIIIRAGPLPTVD